MEVQIPPRRMPEALKDPLKDHLSELEQQGVIEKVTQATDWVSAIVVNRLGERNSSEQEGQRQDKTLR